EDPPVTGSTGGDDLRNMAAFPPDVRPETGPKKELAPQFRRTLVDYPTKEPAIRRTPTSISCSATARRCAMGWASAAKALLGPACNRSCGWRSGPIGIRRRK